ncbi:MAG: hypothetical protein HY885_02680 [Deltaproteobacteria bacterium]|nr:hypothetical protein [Deltaproteobacteria bacterium]
MIAWLKNNTKNKWLERYLPFVSKSPEMKIKWLKSAFRKGILSSEEITPYIRLLLSETCSDENAQLAKLVAELDPEMRCLFLDAADVYDTPRLFRLFAAPTLRHAEIALLKKVPPYEKKTQLILDKVFYAVSDYSKELLEQAAGKLMAEGKATEDFRDNYARFQEILGDEEFLLSLYPNARG